MKRNLSSWRATNQLAQESIRWGISQGNGGWGCADWLLPPVSCLLYAVATRLSVPCRSELFSCRRVREWMCIERIDRLELINVVSCWRGQYKVWILLHVYLQGVENFRLEIPMKCSALLRQPMKNQEVSKSQYSKTQSRYIKTPQCTC